MTATAERKEFPCTRCNASVLWMHTEKGKAILVDAPSCPDHTARYDKELNHCHYETCTEKPEEQQGQVTQCRDCGADIVWMTTSKGKKVMVNAETYHNEPEFNSWANKVHWETCPVAIARKAEEEGTTPGVPVTDPALTAEQQKMFNTTDIPF